jgi:hypothetical protein
MQRLQISGFRKPDVSEEHTASIFRVKEELKQETSRSRQQAQLFLKVETI